MENFKITRRHYCDYSRHCCGIDNHSKGGEGDDPQALKNRRINTTN